MRRVLNAYRWLVLLLATLVALSATTTVDAQVSVSGYYRKDGTYVRPHHRSSPDGNFRNNWSTVGNVNPYTGKVGTRTSPPANYGQDVKVRGYTRSNGTYVAPHVRSAPDGDLSNNFGASGSRNSHANVRASSAGDQTSSITPWLNDTPTARAPVTRLKVGMPSPGNVLAASAPEPMQAEAPVPAKPPKRETIKQMITRLEQCERSKRPALAADLKKVDPSVSWLDLTMRIHYAEMLAELDVKVDWQSYFSASDIQEDWYRARQAKELEKRGIKVVWQERSLSELVAMEAPPLAPQLAEASE
jgi:hypothetical protein